MTKQGKQIACEMHTCLLILVGGSEGEGEFYEDGRGSEGHCRGGGGGAGEEKGVVEAKRGGGQ